MLVNEIQYICAQPAIPYYAWQVEIWLNSLLQFNINPSAIHVVCSGSLMNNAPWQALRDKFIGVNFAFYEDARANRTYISSIRPHILAKHWLKHPNLYYSPVYYCDCDVLFLNDPRVWLEPLAQDSVIYLSDARGYVGYDYFKSKEKEVSKRNSEFDIDAILQKLFDRLGHDLPAFKSHSLDSGGAQHLLKNIDSFFWANLERDCSVTYEYFNYNSPNSINNKFFESENKGFQSWTSDMWAMVWNLLKRNKILKIVGEMDFAWPGYKIEPKWNILHNAGVIDDKQCMFYKGKYQSELPYGQDFSGIDPTIMSSIYVQAIQKTALTTCLK